MATFGKIIGGGMPVGAFGGARPIMSGWRPTGIRYQAGTLSGNPVAMAAGLATLDLLERESGWEQAGGARRASSSSCWRRCSRGRAFRLHLVRAGLAAVAVAARRPAPRAPAACLTEADGALRGRCSTRMLERGIYLPPSAYEVLFLSLAHCEADLQRFAQALRVSPLASDRMKRTRVFQITALAAGRWWRRCRWAGGCSISTPTRREKRAGLSGRLRRADRGRAGAARRRRAGARA